jgi:predicted cobalt transporter CbtA
MRLFVIVIAEISVDACKLAVGTPKSVDNHHGSDTPSEPAPGCDVPSEEVDEEEYAHADIYHNHKYSESGAHDACGAWQALSVVVFVAHNSPIFSAVARFCHSAHASYITLTPMSVDSSAHRTAFFIAIGTVKLQKIAQY